MSTPEDGGTVRYNVKDLLAAIDRKLDTVVQGLNQKADSADVRDLVGRVAALEKASEVSVLLANSRESNKDRSFTRGQQLIASFSALAATAALFISGLQWLHHSPHHP